MNEIEQQFADAFCRYYEIKNLSEVNMDTTSLYDKGEPQYPVGIYVVDFAFFRNFYESKDKDDYPSFDLKFAIEIDGQESHKTKEQRFKDYRRERFLQMEGFTIIRFTGSEIFVDPFACVKEADGIMEHFIDMNGNFAEAQMWVGFDEYENVKRFMDNLEKQHHKR